MPNARLPLAALLAGTCAMVACAADRNEPRRSAPQLPQQEQVLRTVLFGSCAKQDRPQPIWNAVVRHPPDLFLFLGDNIYADTRDPAVFDRKYAQLAGQPGFQRLIESTPILATWDDHDYGENDAGSEYPLKVFSRRRMLDFWGEPEDSPRRTQDGGIYTARVIGPPGRRVQIILLDLRYNRSPLRSADPKSRTEREANNVGPYAPDTLATATLLGEAQWRWLERELEAPAELRLLGSSIQALPEFTGWEAWANFPRERERLLRTIDRHAIDNLILLSGDTHWAELSRDTTPGGRLVWELTSSGLTEEWKQVSPDAHRVGEPYVGPNFGVVHINWDAEPVEVDLSIHDLADHAVLRRTLRIQAHRSGSASG